jgi:hypothetical protein
LTEEEEVVMLAHKDVGISAGTPLIGLWVNIPIRGLLANLENLVYEIFKVVVCVLDNLV